MKRIILGVMLCAGVVFGGKWPQWRGAELDGSCDAKNLPTEWSVESGENIAWTCELPGTGQSTLLKV